jgi:hypothetical protein
MVSSGEKFFSVANNTQSILAFLLASATAATFLFRRSRSLPNQLSWFSLSFLALSTALAPWISSVLG